MISIVAFSVKGCSLANRIASMFEDCKVYSKTESDVPDTIGIQGSLMEWTGSAMESSDSVIFIGATGIAVRMIAPFLKNKKVDPAVICMDDNGKFVISLLSGHVGGANRLAEFIAKGIGGTAVVTTASDVNGNFAIDEYAVTHGMWYLGTQRAKDVSACIVNGRDVGFVSEEPVKGEYPKGIVPGTGFETGILVTAQKEPIEPFDRTLILIPKKYVVGIGCKRDTPYENVRELYLETFDDLGLSPYSVKSIASIDLKKDENAIMMLAEEFRAPREFFASDELNALEDIGFSRSEFVRSVTAVDCVCERSAVKAAGCTDIICKKRSKNGVTIAIVRTPFEVDFTEVNQ